MSDQLTQLAKLREAFQAHQISKLPKPSKAQTEAIKADFRKGIRCTLCGAWHHPDVVHLDYVGHAALTDRLLSVDPMWAWEPAATDPTTGMPMLDPVGGLWIKLTVCGVTRWGYGHAGEKEGGDAIKEIIGDALRNAAMRFGCALDLWHKGDLHKPEEDGVADPLAGAKASFKASTFKEPALSTQDEATAKTMEPGKLLDWLNCIAAASDEAELLSLKDDGLKAAETLKDRDAYAAIRSAFTKRHAVLFGLKK